MGYPTKRRKGILQDPSTLQMTKGIHNTAGESACPVEYGVL